MNIELKVVGKTAFDYLKEGIQIYEKRMKKYCSFSMTIIPDIKNAKNLNQTLIKKKEGEVILKKISNQDFLILLDEKGKNYTSVGFAKLLDTKLLPNGKKIIFLVGGAYGFSKEVYDRSNMKISLSSMTFSHQMIRLFFIEQLYRAFTIMNNEPYHHE